mmetsp:Transcript_27436/g.52251  ORF Transcript_27436/g.52251 Transcript_27436/m.52251 type:complete len:234 (-) Transcript_27436:110-811(-)
MRLQVHSHQYLLASKRGGSKRRRRACVSSCRAITFNRLLQQLAMQLRSFHLASKVAIGHKASLECSPCSVLRSRLLVGIKKAGDRVVCSRLGTNTWFERDGLGGRKALVGVHHLKRARHLHSTIGSFVIRMRWQRHWELSGRLKVLLCELRVETPVEVDKHRCEIVRREVGHPGGCLQVCGKPVIEGVHRWSHQLRFVLKDVRDTSRHPTPCLMQSRNKHPVWHVTQSGLQLF